MTEIEISDEEIVEFCKDFFKKIKENPESYIKIVIGIEGCGTIYNLQDLKKHVQDIITNDDCRKFELQHKMFIDKDWEYYFD